MKLITGPHFSGKTTKLIHLAAELDRYIVCVSKERCKDVFNHANNIGIKIKYPLTPRELYQSKWVNREDVLVDDIDKVLRKVLGYHTEYATLLQDTNKNFSKFNVSCKCGSNEATTQTSQDEDGVIYIYMYCSECQATEILTIVR